jgi:putative flippase GtrA
MMLLVSGFHMNYMMASAMIAIVMMLANFALHRAWTFASRG